jgi:hypothetical protein
MRRLLDAPLEQARDFADGRMLVDDRRQWRCGRDEEGHLVASELARRLPSCQHSEDSMIVNQRHAEKGVFSGVVVGRSRMGRFQWVRENDQLSAFDDQAQQTGQMSR